jgi:hypothetical protein
LENIPKDYNRFINEQKSGTRLVEEEFLTWSSIIESDGLRIFDKHMRKIIFGVILKAIPKIWMVLEEL